MDERKLELRRAELADAQAAAAEIAETAKAMQATAERMVKKLGATALHGSAFDTQLDAVWYEADKTSADTQRLGEALRELSRRYYG